jgi:hypothetical protein
MPTPSGTRLFGRQGIATLCGLSLALLLAPACKDDVKADAGLDADLTVDGAQFFRGAVPTPNGGPDVLAVSLSTTNVFAGTGGKPVSCTLVRSATAAGFALQGDVGYWLLPSGAAAVETPGEPAVKTQLSFSRTVALGTRSLLVFAVDQAGKIGAVNETKLTVTDPYAPKGRLIVSLSWDTEADLDLHVVDPAGVEIYKGNINSYQRPAPGTPVDPTAARNGGILDFDSNAACTTDGRRAEHVTYAAAPPPGHYTVRVDTFSLCDAPSANWRVSATLDGKSLGVAQGESTDADEQTAHDRGAGVLALGFDVP